MIVRILHSAEAELEAIGDYIARDNPRRALSFVRDLGDKCMGLADMPLAYPLVPRYEDRGVRHRVHGSYQIFYRVNGQPERIPVIHILHSARDIAATCFRRQKRKKSPRELCAGQAIDYAGAELTRKVAVCGIPAAASSMRSAIKVNSQLSKQPRLS
ncbi:type II toxin-antitoxin system RelE/ParE family toxin [Caballeronia sp. RCC_10]|uniref:type II toxin-antitoxin system RelE/ParE family toxin n=1 Tax=Caballeronia sp. RCC_10 TaxID=3239227 RepID=UPI003523C632